LKKWKTIVLFLLPKIKEELTVFCTVLQWVSVFWLFPGKKEAGIGGKNKTKKYAPDTIIEKKSCKDTSRK